MPRLAVMQTNFTAGEVSPRTKGRIDIARYQNGADVIENGIPVVHGGVLRRYGLRYLATAKLGGTRRVRVLRYVFSTEFSFMLEFGHQFIRFFEGDTGAVILNSAGTAPYEVVSPYTEDQIFDVTTKQDASAMYLFHPDVPTQRLRRLAAAQWIMEAVPWVTAPFAEIGHSPNAALTLSAATVGTDRTFTTTPTSAPAAPTIDTAYPLNGKASVNFTPGSNGGLAVTHYTATSSPDGITAQGTQSPIRVDGLTNGVAYTFTVTATNGVGTSPASAASNSVTPDSTYSGGSITATADTLNFSASVLNGKRLSIPGPTASGVGGTTPYTYNWTKISGNGAVIVKTANAAQVTYQSEGYGETIYAVFRCTVIDALDAEGTIDVNIATTHEAIDLGTGA